jgi:hypothetical protein
MNKTNTKITFPSFFRLNIQLILGGFTLLLLSACSQKSNPYRFLVAGHVYGSPVIKTLGLHPPFVADFDYIKGHEDLKFGVFTGDIVYYSRDNYWDAVDADIEKLGIPIHFAAGNHDEGHKSPYKERYGKTYYSFEQEQDLFIVLNPGLNGWNIQNEQLAFLKNILQKSHQYHHIFLFFHHVLWWSPDNKYHKWGPNSLDGRGPKINFWSEIMPLLQSLKQPVYCFAGDVGANHTTLPFFAAKEQNVHFLASGMGNLKEDNYLIINIKQDKTIAIELRNLQTKSSQTIEKWWNGN